MLSPIKNKEEWSLRMNLLLEEFSIEEIQAFCKEASQSSQLNNSRYQLFKDATDDFKKEDYEALGQQILPHFIELMKQTPDTRLFVPYLEKWHERSKASSEASPLLSSSDTSQDKGAEKHSRCCCWF